MLSKPFWLLSQHSLHRPSRRPLCQQAGSTKKGQKSPWSRHRAPCCLQGWGTALGGCSQPRNIASHGHCRPVATASAPKREESEGETAVRNWEGSERRSWGLVLFFYYLIYFFLIKANEVELQERCKSLIGKSFFRALPDSSFRYENITAGSRRRKFPSGRADWMERKTPPSSDVFLEKGQIPRIFPSLAMLRSFLQVPWAPPPSHTRDPSRGQAMARPTPGMAPQGRVRDGWTDALGMLSWDSCSPGAGDVCSGRCMGEGRTFPIGKKSGKIPNSLQKPILPQPKCLHVRHQGLVQTIKVWFKSRGLVGRTKLLCFPSLVSALKTDLF